MTEQIATYKPESARCVLIRVSVTPEEKELIQSRLTTRERAELLLACVELKKVANVEGWEAVKEAWDTAGEILYRLYGKDET